MTKEIRVPTLGESVTEATIAKWFKAVGEQVEKDEAILELETDKVALEVNAPVAGALVEIVAKEGDTVEVDALLGSIDEGAKGSAKAAPKAAGKTEEKSGTEPAPKSEAAASPKSKSAAADDVAMMPAARKLAEENDLDPTAITGTGKDGRITKTDVVNYLESKPADKNADKQDESSGQATAESAPAPQAAREERVPMTRLRKRIAQRLKDAQNTAAMLTTYNEVDMSPVMAVRDKYRDMFERKHGVRMGFMSFFVKACTQALQEMPDVNASIDGDDIIYKNYYNIGVAASTPAGLVVPVVRDCDQKSFAAVEQEINNLAKKARDGKLGINDMQGGTFTISNGGVFGSLMSSPILNPPQSAILGMHAIKKRPVVVDDEIVIRPMMYLALSYDHRLIDGQGAVTFLVRVKEFLEDPNRLLLDL